MNLKALPVLLALPILAAVASCTPNRDLTTDSPHWPGEYRGGYNNDDTADSMPPASSDDDPL